MATRKKKPKPVIWETPPERPHRYPWDEIAEELRTRPMEWAKIYEQDRATVATAIRAGSIAAVHPDLGFESQTRNNTRGTGTRTCDLYLRWNPEKENLSGAIREEM